MKIAELDNIILSQEQEDLFNKFEKTNSSFFVTGKAGTGKSLLLQYFKTYTKKNIVVVAPTGVAALNVGGQTINSLFRIPPAVITKEKQRDLKLNATTSALLNKLDTVVIDEISMVRVDMLEAIDYLLKKAKKSHLPFGGVQMIMFGDLYQLPPVVTSRELQNYFVENYGGVYCFNADSWKAADLQIISLSNIFRQTDSEFIDMLNSVRSGNPDKNLLLKLNKRVAVELPDEGSITLATTNRTVSEINNKRLAALDSPVHEFRAEITGSLEESAFPTDEILKLKVGSQIMMLKNDKDKRWVNGTLGIIHAITSEGIKVDLGGNIYTVLPDTWNKINYFYDRVNDKVEEEIVSTFKQYPLRLAWAITIHKSQGQTYNSVIIDLGDGAFAHGQTYVALSRCIALDTLYLKRQVEYRDIIVDQSVVTFMNPVSVE